GMVPLEYLNYSEITVTRRLFRDGTSEYLINKIPVRLRDVVDFFLGTGVGTKAYSIIEQGRVGMIVTSKPEDRRMLIEEAAGITKYKAKKKAAERKMDGTRQNLLRVTDVLGELDKQLGSLRDRGGHAAARAGARGRGGAARGAGGRVGLGGRRPGGAVGARGGGAGAAHRADARAGLDRGSAQADRGGGQRDRARRGGSQE